MTRGVDPIDRRIIQLTQAGLPLTPQPYQSIATQIGITADDVMQRINAMLESGTIRRIGAVPNHYKLGYRYNGMTVWNIPDEQIDAMGERVGRLEFVSHCYHRPRHCPDWPYNLFAMVHARTEQEVNQKMDTIAAVLGEYNQGQDVLYSSRILKKTGLRIKG